MDITITDNGRLCIGGVANEPVVLHPLWLRERLPDAAILDPHTGQRLQEAAETPLDLRITAAQINGPIAFSDGFVTRLPSAWLRARLGPAPACAPVLWDGARGEIPGGDLAQLQADPAALCAFLGSVESHGFAVVRGVPDEMDGALAFADLLGPIRQTNWGGIADVKAIADAYDLTMTPRYLEPHTDNPYRDPIPGYVLLHCLKNDADGGDTTLADGFHAATILRGDDPAAFTILTQTQVNFSYHDATAFLENYGPLIETDGAGTVIRVRYSNRTEMVARLAADALDRYYAARAAFWQLIAPGSPLTLRFRLQPGELLMMDNYRVCHGRTGYTLASGSRHMRQCYVDRDIVGSRRRLLVDAGKEA